VGSFVFWMVALIVSLTIFSGSHHLAGQIERSLCVMLFGAFSAGFLYKNFLLRYCALTDSIAIAGGILSTITVMLLAMLLTLYLFDRRQFLELYGFIRQSLTNP
jgi:hypothetical protein